jgi:chromosome segregation ATPase
MTISHNFVKTVLCCALFAILSPTAHAAKRDTSGDAAKMVAKLQGMVKDITAERDTLKTENGKVSSELEALKTQIEQNKKDKEAALAAQEKLTADLAVQKSAEDDVRGKLDNTTGKLREVVEKYNVLNKAKNDLAAAYANLQNNQQATTNELKACETKNVKMHEGAKEIIENFHACQKKGIIDALVDSEPFTQINDVEFETVMQGYEDKLNKQKYQPKPATKAAPANSVAVPADTEAAEPAPVAPAATPVKK